MDRTFCVLLVEDDPVVGEACVAGLTLLGHRVSWVRSVAAAFKALTAPHAFQVVLLDLGLGEERGDTIFTKIQLLSIPYPPVIVFSADPDPVVSDAAKRIKTPHTLSKPASIGQINRALQVAATSDS